MGLVDILEDEERLIFFSLSLDVRTQREGKPEEGS